MEYGKKTIDDFENPIELLNIIRRLDQKTTMSRWESDFIQPIAKMMCRYGISTYLTDRQYQKIQELKNRYFKK